MDFTPGDILLVHGTGFFDKLIQYGQLMRFPPPQAYWNHVALITSPDGNLIEAIGKGVKQTNISKYVARGSETKVIHIEATWEDRQEAIAYASSCLSDGYDWTALFTTALCLVFGLRFSFGFDSRDICSGLVARALERTQYIFKRDSTHMTPADLAAFFGV